VIEPSYTKAYVVAVAVVIVVAALLVVPQFLSRPAALGSRMEEGVFICEACGYQWKGAYELEARDFYVVCPKCGERRARLAVECPHCHRNFLPPLPEHDKPLKEMNALEFERWYEQYKELRKRAECPYCKSIVGSEPFEFEELSR